MVGNDYWSANSSTIWYGEKSICSRISWNYLGITDK